MVLTVPDAGAYEPDIKAIGRHILATAGVQPPLILQPDWWESQALELANRDPAFRTQLLRFLEVFPTLRTVDHMASHIQEYFEDPSGELPPVLRWGIKAAWPGQLTTGLVARTIEYNLNLVSQTYIAGKTRFAGCTGRRLQPLSISWVRVRRAPDGRSRCRKLTWRLFASSAAKRPTGRATRRPTVPRGDRHLGYRSR